jgi:hypothetical protein
VSEAIPQAFSVESDKLLELPPVCVSCGKPTGHKMRIDVGAGDTKTEAVNAILSFLPLPIPFLNSARVPCCKRCVFKVNVNVLIAFAMMPLGLALLMISVSPDGLLSRMPEAVRMAVCFVAVVGGFGGALIFNALAHHRRVPVQVFALSGGRYRYVFFSHIYKVAVEKEPALASR